MSQGEILVRRKLQNTLDAQRQTTTQPSYHQSSPFSSSPSTFRHHHAEVGRSALMDDEMDSPPRRPWNPQFSSASGPTGNCDGSHQKQFNGGNGHPSKSREDPSRASALSASVDAAASLRDEIIRLQQLLREKDDIILSQQRELEDLKRSASAQQSSALHAKLDTLAEAMQVLPREGISGLERLQQSLHDELKHSAALSSPPPASHDSTALNASSGGTPTAKAIRHETEEERMQRALYNSVRQRYMQRFRQ